MVFFLYLAFKTFNAESTETFCLMSVGIGKDVRIRKNSIYKIFIHKSQNPQFLPILRGKISCFQWIKFNLPDFPLVISGGNQPCGMCLGIGNHKMILFDTFFQNLWSSRLNIYLIKFLGKKQKQLIIFVYISKRTKIFFQKLVRFRAWYENFFFYHIPVAVVMIDTDTAVSFMNTAVHITI